MAVATESMGPWLLCVRTRVLLTMRANVFDVEGVGDLESHVELCEELDGIRVVRAHVESLPRLEAEV